MSQAHPREQSIREQRTIEATIKNYVGPPGKIGTIARYLGKQIIRQGSGLMDVNYLESAYKEFDEKNMPTFTEEESCLVLEGWIFDGLSRGMHLEIRYIDFQKELSVVYKGYPVYVERAGDISTFAPFPEWEEKIEKLYAVARKLQQEHHAGEKEEIIEEAKKQKKDLLTRLRMIWGL